MTLSATDDGSDAISSMTDPGPTSCLKDNAFAQLRSPGPARPGLDRNRNRYLKKEEKRILEAV